MATPLADDLEARIIEARQRLAAAVSPGRRRLAWRRLLRLIAQRKSRGTG